MELVDKYRPIELSDIVGQEEATDVLQEMVDNNRLPKVLLLTGPSGTGKTTVARILKIKMECVDRDFIEVNAASKRGINAVREIEQSIGMSPWGNCRMWLIDEVHQLTKKKGGDAQTALLKVLEDVPANVYFILATTDPNDLRKTIRTRCVPINFKPIAPEDLCKLLTKISKKENITLSSDVRDRIVEISDGSARQALKLLEKVRGIEDEDKQLDCLLKGEVKTQAIELARALIKPNCKWSDVAPILKDLKGEDEESLRRMILGYASSVMLNGGGKIADRAYLLLVAFESNFFDSGFSGLVRATWEVCNPR